MPDRPTIVITATARSEEPSHPVRVRLNAAYVDAIARAGGVALVAPPQPSDAARAVLAAADGLLLTGGEDIAPHLFGEQPHPHLGRVTEARDHWEIALLQEAKRRRLPTLGICRGIQVVNVALGGTLVQDIPSGRPGALAHEQPVARDQRTHVVAVRPGSKLAAIYGLQPRVNSMHHQAIDRPGAGLVVTATAPDGIIEAVEAEDPAWWMIAVQWHPEELDGADADLFTTFLRRLTADS